MAAPEWLRTFVAIYRDRIGQRRGRPAEPVPTGGQPAAAVPSSAGSGLPLFVRTPQGVEPTRRGRELHAQVADSLDRLEPCWSALDGGAAPAGPPAIRLGSSAEFLSYAVVPRLDAGRARAGGQIRNRRGATWTCSSTASSTWP